jgi:predicted nucleic acid binding AN1-type Zn finger protein
MSFPLNISSLVFNFDAVTASEAATSTAAVTAAATAATAPKENKRCPTCRHKLALTDFACRCGPKFCSAHRLPESHSCTFDFRERDRAVLSNQLVKVVADKMGEDRLN